MGLIGSWLRRGTDWPRNSDPPVDPSLESVDADLFNTDSDSSETPSSGHLTYHLSTSHASSRGTNKNVRNRLVTLAERHSGLDIFEKFLISRRWTFTGLKEEDHSPETSASNFMCLKTRYGDPKNVIFQPVIFNLVNQCSITMVWDVGQVEIQWVFSGCHWRDAAIRRSSLGSEALHPASLTVGAMIRYLRLPIWLINLPIQKDHTGRVLNEDPISFSAVGRNWIKDTVSESLTRCEALNYSVKTQGQGSSFANL